MTAQIKLIVEEHMTRDDETTAHQLRALLGEEGVHRVSPDHFSMPFHSWVDFPWECVLPAHSHREKRYNWVVANKDDEFEDVIYTDECSVQLETHKRFCCRKEGQPAKPKPKAKHPVKVHVWAGISKRGATKVCIFDGIMNRWLYIDILDKTLKPFVRSHFSNGHRVVADNDPKHTSNDARD